MKIMMILVTTVMRILCLVTILTVIGIHGGEQEWIVTWSIVVIGYIWALAPIYYRLKYYVKLLFAKGEKDETN